LNDRSSLLRAEKNQLKARIEQTEKKIARDKEQAAILHTGTVDEEREKRQALIDEGLADLIANHERENFLEDWRLTTNYGKPGVEDLRKPRQTGNGQDASA